MKLTKWIGGLCLSGTAAMVALALFPLLTRAQQTQNQNSDPLEIVHVRGNIYLLAGAGGNITLSAGPDGVLMVDTGSGAMSDKVIAAIKRLTTELTRFGQPVKRNEGGGGSGTVLTSYAPPKPIRFIINTSPQPDFTGGNVTLATAGKTFTGGNVAGDLGDIGEGAAVLSHENLLQRLSDEKMPIRGQPTETYFGGQMKLSHFFNDEGVQLIHVPNAITDGDSFVNFRVSDVISAGDIFDFASYPPIDMKKGGTVQGVIVGLNKMLDIVIPEFRSEGGTYVIPGHGRVCDMADLAYYRDMMTIIRDRVQDMIKKNMTREQIIAAKPTEDWDGRFGKMASWTPDMFVATVYDSLTAPAAAKNSEKK